MKQTFTTPLTRPLWRSLLWSIGTVVILCGGLLTLLIHEKTQFVVTASESVVIPETPALPPFPVGVNPDKALIVEDPSVDEFFARFVASNHMDPRLGESWHDRLLNRLAMSEWFQQLATPATRVLVVQSGQRHEEVAANFARILRWSARDKEEFAELITREVPTFKNGKLFPGRYVVASDASPETVAIAIADRFNAEVRTRYTDEIAAQVPLEDALIIASLIEREAYDFTDMRYISGVIWNRLFIDMKLQIDATLQYARGAQSAAAGGRWWPVPRSQDKFLTSPFNTYQNLGLPPEPIANPSIDAIIAALNPRATDCLFYYHTNDGTFYCNETYPEHVAGIKKHLKGQ